MFRKKRIYSLIVLTTSVLLYALLIHLGSDRQTSTLRNDDDDDVENVHNSSVSKHQHEAWRRKKIISQAFADDDDYVGRTLYKETGIADFRQHLRNTPGRISDNAKNGIRLIPSRKDIDYQLRDNGPFDVLINHSNLRDEKSLTKVANETFQHYHGDNSEANLATFFSLRSSSSHPKLSYPHKRDIQLTSSAASDSTIPSCYDLITNVNATEIMTATRKLKSKPDLEKLNCTKRFPKGAIIGVKKGGTDALTYFLNLHPYVESRHGCSDRFMRYVPHDLRGLRDEQVAENAVEDMGYTTPEQITVINHPGFIASKRVRFDILAKWFPPGTPLILILRNPVKRAVSDYVHELDKLNWMENANPEVKKNAVLESEIEYTFELTITDEKGRVKDNERLVKVGRYVETIEAMLKDHPEYNLLMLDGDEFAKDPFPSLKRVESFLGLPPFFKREHFRFVKEKGFYCAFVPERPDLHCLDHKKGRPHPEVDPNVLEALMTYYQPHNRRLQTLLNATFSWM